MPIIFYFEPKINKKRESGLSSKLFLPKQKNHLAMTQQE
jgi:hypothetical protein